MILSRPLSPVVPAENHRTRLLFSRMTLRVVAAVAAGVALCCSNTRCSVSAFAFTAPLSAHTASIQQQQQRAFSMPSTSWDRRVQQQLRVLDARPRGVRAPRVVAAAGRSPSMAQEPLILTEENVIAVLAEAKKELGTLFGNNAENTSVGITGDCEFVCLDGPSVVVRLTGRFWHEKSTVLARVGSFVQTRIPECVDVEIEDPAQLEDADPQGRGQGAEM